MENTLNDDFFLEINKYSNHIDQLFSYEEGGIEFLIEKINKSHSENNINIFFKGIQSELLVPFNEDMIEDKLNYILKIIVSKRELLEKLTQEILAVLYFLEIYEIEEQRESLGEIIYQRKKTFNEGRMKNFNYDISNLSHINDISISKRLNFLLKNKQNDEKINEYLDKLLESSEITINILAVHIQMLEVSKLMLKNEFFGSFFYLKICFDSEENENLPIFKSTYAKNLFFELKKNELFGNSAQGLMALHNIFTMEKLFKTYLKDTTYINWANQFFTFQRIMKPKELKMDKYFETYRLIKTKFDKRNYFM